MTPIKQIIVKKSPSTLPSAGILLAENHVYPCILGKNGITTRKVEGDMKTPVGKFQLICGYFRKDRTASPPSLLSFDSIKFDMGWCDDVGDPNYNRLIRLPFKKSHEVLLRRDELYDIIVVMNHNYHHRIKGRGSAVFFHLTADKPYTAGCVAIPKEVMIKLLTRLSPKTELVILP